MKTILTMILAIAVMVFAFDESPAFADDEDCEGWDVWGGDCHLSQIDELKDSDQADNENENEVADFRQRGSHIGSIGIRPLMS